MKLSATLKNNRGGSKVTADDTRILVELRWGNTIIGTIGLYTIKDNKVEGYRVIWQNEKYSSSDKPLREFIREIKGKQQTGKHLDTCTGKICNGLCNCKCHYK